MTRLNSGKKVEGLKVDKSFYKYNILSFKEVKIQKRKGWRMEGNATRSWSSVLIFFFYFYHSSRTFDFILLIFHFFFLCVVSDNLSLF